MKTLTLLLVLLGAGRQDGPTPLRLEPTVAARNLQTKVAPAYPTLAWVARAQGTVVLEATIDKEGRVSDVNVLKGISFFNEGTSQAVRQWRYKPYEVNGEPRSVVTAITLNYFLDSPPRIPAGAASITGRVVPADGTPAAGIRVDVALPNGLSSPANSPPTFTESSGQYSLRAIAQPLLRAGFLTDSSGQYRIDGIGPGTYNVGTTIGDKVIYYPGAPREGALAVTIESNETMLVGIDFAIP